MNQITDNVLNKVLTIFESEHFTMNSDTDDDYRQEFVEEYFNTGSYYTIRDVEVETYTMRDMCEILDYVNKNHKEMCPEPYDFTGIIDLLNIAIYFKARDLIQYEWERVQEYLDENEEEVEPAQ